MKILITGGAGFVGSHMVNRFYNQDHDIIVLDALGHTSSMNRLKNVDVQMWKGRLQRRELTGRSWTCLRVPM